LDTSCQLEGTLILVEQRRHDLQCQLAQAERVLERLKADIEVVEVEDPSHPIITLPPVSIAPQEEAPASCPGTPIQMVDKSSTPTLCESPTILTEGDDGVELTHSPSTPGRDPYMPTDLGSPFTIDNADLSAQFSRRLSTAEDGLLSIYQRMEDNEPPGIVEVGCSSFLFGRICASNDDDEEGVRRLIGLSFDSEGSDVISPPRPPTLTSSLATSPSMGSASPSQRPLPSPHRTSSFDTIDFRTGMSGHRALLSARTADSRVAPQSRGRALLMSAHMGIGRIRAPPQTRSKSKGAA